MKSAAAGSPAAREQLPDPFVPGKQQSLKLHDSTGAWPTHAKVAAQRHVSDSDEDPYSSPDTTLPYPGLLAARSADPIRKSDRARVASGFPTPVNQTSCQVPLEAATPVGQSPPQLRRSSLTLAMRGEDAATAAAAAVQSAAASAGTAVLAGVARAPGPGVALRSASEPMGAASSQEAAGANVVPEASASMRRPSLSLLSSSLVAALKGRSSMGSGGPPGQTRKQPGSPKVETYTLTASDAAAIAAAQQHAHPTVRGPAPPAKHISPCMDAQLPLAFGGPNAALCSKKPAVPKVCCGINGALVTVAPFAVQDPGLQCRCMCLTWYVIIPGVQWHGTA